MPRNDTLLQGAAIAFQNARIRRLGAKTRYNHLKEVERFVKKLREVGYGVKKWTNVNNKHVESVVTHWQEKGLSPKTIKEYLSGVRVVAGFFGNTSISGENARFGIPEIKYITNADKSPPKEHY
jgi:site-specific recombinase XerC